MKQNQSITRKFFNGGKIEIRFERYAIQFDDGQWKAIVSIESLEGKIIPGTNKSFKEIIIEAEKIDAFDSLADFVFEYLNTEKNSPYFRSAKSSKLKSHHSLLRAVIMLENTATSS